MIPFYFGDADRPLFGMHHQPISSKFQDTSIVICNPIGFEYGRAHSTLRNLAKNLVSNGYHVLRFDYYATGDSSGQSHEISVEQCIKDIGLACEEIKAISATRKITVIGYRMGAAFSAIASKTYKFNQLILWDPVVDGKAYLNELQVMHDQMLRDSNRFDIRYLSTAENSTELIGYDFTKELRSEMNSIDLKRIERVKSRKIHVFFCQDNPCADSLVQDDNFLAKANCYQLNYRTEWKNIDKIESKVLVGSLIKKIAEVIG